MSEARYNLDWKKMIKLAINPDKVKRLRKSSIPLDSETCTMCGIYCPVKGLKPYIEGKFKINF